MSETYTIFGDALYLLEANHIAGQTFSPVETHLLQYIDLNLESSFFTAPPKVQVYLTNHLNEPTGDPLVNITIHPPSPIIPKINRVRVQIPTPFLLHEGTEYALLCLYDAIVIGTRASWEYDSTLATYPRGHRIHSEDGGGTWTHELGSDHIFCEFGDPPLPKPEPPPPIEPFAPIAIKYTPTWFGLLISLTTATPCHLTCYYTEITPLKHHTSRVIRGLTVPWGTYFCFTGWHALPQIEPGDTLYHTFNFEEWPACLTRWFTIRGEVDDLQSPSVGPIFKYHNLGPPVEKTFIARISDGYLSTPTHIYDYILSHDGTRATAYDTGETWWVGQQFTQNWYIVMRAGLFFDTSEIPANARILSATLSYLVRAKYGWDYDIVIVSGDDLSEPLQQHHYHDLLDDIVSLGSAPAANGYRFQHIPLNELGLTHITRGGLTKLALRTNEDIDAIPPTTYHAQRARSAEYRTKPYLTVTYQA